MGTLASVSGSGGNSEIVPVIKLNAVNGRMSQVERSQDAAGAWRSEDIHMPLPVKFVADFATMKVGPMAFILGRPDFHLVPIADVDAGTATIPERPSAEHRTGFLIRVYNSKMGLREWRGQQKCVLAVMDQIYEAYKIAPEAKQGMLPVVEISDFLALKREGQYPGTDMQPVMAITQWVPRPEALSFEAGNAPKVTNGAVANGADVAPAANGAGAAVGAPARAAVRPAVAAHVPPPRPTQQQVKAGNALHAPPPAPPAGDDEPEFA